MCMAYNLEHTFYTVSTSQVGFGIIKITVIIFTGNLSLLLTANKLPVALFSTPTVLDGILFYKEHLHLGKLLSSQPEVLLKPFSVSLTRCWLLLVPSSSSKCHVPISGAFSSCFSFCIVHYMPKAKLWSSNYSVQFLKGRVGIVKQTGQEAGLRQKDWKSPDMRHIRIRSCRTHAACRMPHAA